MSDGPRLLTNQIARLIDSSYDIIDFSTYHWERRTKTLFAHQSLLELPCERSDSMSVCVDASRIA